MIDRYSKEDGAMVPDPNGEWVRHVDYLADEGNWVPLADYQTLMNQMLELLESLRAK